MCGGRAARVRTVDSVCRKSQYVLARFLSIHDRPLFLTAYVAALLRQRQKLAFVCALRRCYVRYQKIVSL